MSNNPLELRIGALQAEMQSLKALLRSSTTRKGLGAAIHPNLEARLSLTIDKIEPAAPLENTPVKVSFTLTNNFGRATSGVVMGPGGAPTGGVSLIPSLAVKEARSGTVSVTAPRAGVGAVLEIDYWESDGPIPSTSEFALPAATATATVDIAASYSVTLDSFHILRTRSGWYIFGEQDLVILAVSAQLGADAPLTDGRTIGKVGSGNYPVGIRLGSFVGVPGLAPDLTITYLLMNRDFDQSEQALAQEIFDTVSKITQTALDSAYPQGPLWSAVDWVTEQINKLLVANCDGTVAADKISLSSSYLNQVTSGSGAYSETRDYPGSPSDWRCGDSSDYTVTWTIVRESLGTP